MGSRTSKEKSFGDINKLLDKITKRTEFCRKGASKHLKQANAHIRKTEYEGNSLYNVECAKCFKDGRLLFNEYNFLKEMLNTLQELKNEGFGKNKEDRNKELETLKKVNEVMNLYLAISKRPETQAETIKKYESVQPIGPVLLNSKRQDAKEIKEEVKKVVKKHLAIAKENSTKYSVTVSLTITPYS